MSDRSASSSSMGFLSMKSLFCLFLIALMVFILSWFFLLSSTNRPSSIYYNLLPNSKHYTSPENEHYDPRYNPPLMDHHRPLKVFMYDLPSEFHFELLDWKPPGNTIWPDLRSNVPEYPGGLNIQHSIAYWLTLDLLASELIDNPTRTAIRVQNSSQADVIFIPFFSSICFNRFSRLNPHQKTNKNKELQAKLVKHITAQPEWQRSNGIDHIVVAHHPNSLLDARMQLWPAMFIVSDFGRYPPSIANIQKDVIAPYKHIIKTYKNDTSTFETRPILLFFQGAIYRKDGGFARQEIFYLLKNENDVHFSFGSVHKNGVLSATKGMHSSKFCLNIAGDTPSSNRLFDAIASHCVPVIISDDIELPFEDILDYSEFCVFVKTSDAIKEKFLINLIRSIGKDEWDQKWAKLKEIEHFFEYQYPSKKGDAVEMIWRAVSKKVPAIKRRLHAARRFARFGQAARTARGSGKSFPLPRNLTF